MQASELITIPGTWNFEYRYFAGETASRFFNALQHEARICGTSCPKCARVLVPARSFCDACFVATEGWIETGPGGVLEFFTVVGAQFPGLRKPPFIIAYVTVDGADTAILNYLEGVDLTDIDVAANGLMQKPRVRAKFAPHREGRITDFHFELDPS